MTVNRKTCTLLTIMVLWGSGAALAADAPTTLPTEPQPATSSPLGSDLTQLSLEDLMNVTVNSVSKIDESISQAPAAVTVISQEDIRRSGLTSIPELMRLAPGMDVARINAAYYAISSRGFNSELSDKLLVMMDGRTVYDPLFAGVLWDRQDYVLADLDKIEVIRGPGATLWGSNAVNGVINITTKSARDTQGGLLDITGGTSESNASLRYGSQIDPDTFYRVYGKFRYTTDLTTTPGVDADDGWNGTRGGFRIDRYPDKDNILTLQGDAQNNALNTPFPGDNLVSPRGYNGNLLGRWTHTEAPDSGLALQVYYDHLTDNIPPVLNYNHDALDVDFQQHFPLGSFQEITYGLGARFELARTQNGLSIGLLDGSREDYITSSFVQDDVALAPNRLHVILGSKFEYSSYDGFQVEPSAKIMFTPDERNSYWGSVSRAIRAPSLDDLNERNVLGGLGGPGTVSLGNPNIKPEEVEAYEAGYRSHLTKDITFDLALFYNRYDQLTADALLPDNNTTIVNSAHGNSYGAELSCDYNVTPDWRLSGSYTFFLSHASTEEGAVLDTNNNVDAAPEYQGQLHSYSNITDNLEFNASAYYVGAIDTAGQYTRVDLGLDWRPRPNLDLGITVQNLLPHRHSEFNAFPGVLDTEAVSRSLYTHLTYSF